jgi:ubiquinone/menaquinone biosynthesis C-methylase UbiE
MTKGTRERIDERDEGDEGDKKIIMENKVINRDTESNKIFDDRTLGYDYRTLTPLLKPGMKVLDIGCGTGSITRDIAKIVGHVTGIDNTEKFIESGKKQFSDVKNLELIAIDLFKYNPQEDFDLIVSARTTQWLSDVPSALIKMKSMLKAGGTLSILDYNHTKLQWTPDAPQSMKKFYAAFLKWREVAGMDNAIADHLSALFGQAGFKNIEVLNSDERYDRIDENFRFRAGIWITVAGLKQVVEEGYISELERLKAIEDYERWIHEEGQTMIVKLNEVRGVK